MQDKLATIILNWNLAGDTVACVRSLLAAGADPRSIFVIDNGSSDDSLPVLYRELGTGVNLVALTENLGFAGGNNHGIRVALERGFEWIFLLNNDTLVDPNLLRALTAAQSERPAWRLISPLIFYHSDPQRIWALGDQVVPGTLITRRLLYNQVAPPDLPPLIDVDFLTACALVVHRSVFERIGLLDTDYFMYGEDADFCWRARQAGFRLGCATRAQLWHKVSLSTGVFDPRARYWRTTSLIRFYRRHARGAQWLAMLAFSTLQALRQSVADLLAGRGGLAITTWRAWRDGWIGAK